MMWIRDRHYYYLPLYAQILNQRIYISGQGRHTGYAISVFIIGSISIWGEGSINAGVIALSSK